MPTNEGDAGLQVFLKAVALKVSPMEVFIEDVFMYKMSAVLQSFSSSHHAAVASPQRFQITKNAKNYIFFFVKLIGHTYACKILTNFKYAVRVITGNGNHDDLLQSICKKLVK